MQYPLPQFLQIKPKIAGPFNFRQLAYIVGGALISVIFYFTTTLWRFIIISIPIMITAFVFAFAKIKGFPITTILVRSFGFLFKSKTYIWHKIEMPAYSLPKKPKKNEETELKLTTTPKIAEKSRLKQVAKLIEIHPK
jgi:hypothetical protein